jgi:actin cytoskeleton-regulatory complex protein SLA1
MSTEEYLAVLKASYDYSPQSDDEIEVKEDQLLFLLERVDEEQVSYLTLHTSQQL